MRGWRRGAVVLVAAAVLVGPAQMHKVTKPEKVVRAVGVYEWTGDLGHPAASRMVPVSLFIDGELQDAGVYLARPVPFALEQGTEYELDSAGVTKGDLALETAAKVQTPDDAYTDGWIGYGGYRAPVAAVAKAASGKGRPARVSGTVEVAETNDAKPHFGSRPDDATKGKDASGSTGTDPAAAEEDPADRPTLKRRVPVSPAEAKKEKKKQGQASVTGVGSLNDDPDRPTLHRGNAAGAEGADRDVPKLMGLPPEMHQMVAVSDAATRDAHPFARAWEGEGERLAVLGKMRAMAAAQLLAYAKKAGAGGMGAGAAPGVSASSGRASASGTVPRLRAGAGSGVKTRRAGPGAAMPVLLDEEIRGFLLSYGGAPTYVYTAHTPGTGDTLRYVTVVAQAMPTGELEQAMGSVTDAAHLDRTPWMRLVDAVDAEASNRASLLFELRGHEARQFALYRVLGGRADEVFVTGTTQ